LNCFFEYILAPYEFFLSYVVALIFQALSKEHAVIEVMDENNHLIYDLGSRNKTRLGKVNSNFKKKKILISVWGYCDTVIIQL
jgi:hypothetical protein